MSESYVVYKGVGLRLPLYRERSPGVAQDLTGWEIILDARDSNGVALVSLSSTTESGARIDIPDQALNPGQYTVIIPQDVTVDITWKVLEFDILLEDVDGVLHLDYVESLFVAQDTQTRPAS